MTLFEGAGVALVTPFKENGEVNYEKLEEIVEEQIAGGTDAIIACGTTGEASTMTHEEHLEVIEIHLQGGQKNGSCGCGDRLKLYGDSRLSLRGGREERADGLLLVSPYYNKATQKGLMGPFYGCCGRGEDSRYPL